MTVLGEKRSRKFYGRPSSLVELLGPGTGLLLVTSWSPLQTPRQSNQRGSQLMSALQKSWDEKPDTPSIWHTNHLLQLSQADLKIQLFATQSLPCETRWSRFFLQCSSVFKRAPARSLLSPPAHGQHGQHPSVWVCAGTGAAPHLCCVTPWPQARYWPALIQ